MRNSILNECGNYSAKLQDISNEILEMKLKNGQKINNYEVELVEYDIYKAFNKILANTKDGNAVAEAVKNLGEAVSAGTDNIEKATTIAIESVLSKNVLYEWNPNKTEELTSAVAIIGIETNIKEKFVDSVFNKSMKVKMDDVIKSAQKGDEKSTSTIELLSKVSNFVAQNAILDEKKERAVLVFMKRLAVDNSPAARELLNQLANQYKMNDIMSNSDNGEKQVDDLKLQEKFEIVIGKINPKIAKITNEELEKMNESSGRQAMETGKYTKNDELNADRVIELSKQNSKKIMIRKAIDEACKTGDKHSLDLIVKSEPDLAKELIKIRLNALKIYKKKNFYNDKVEYMQYSTVLLGESILRCEHTIDTDRYINKGKMEKNVTDKSNITLTNQNLDLKEER